MIIFASSRSCFVVVPIIIPPPPKPKEPKEATTPKEKKPGDAEGETTKAKAEAKDQRELIKAAYRATLHYHPEVLNDDKWLKQAVHRLLEEEALKDRTARVIAQLPVEVALFLLNEKKQQKNKNLFPR